MAGQAVYSNKLLYLILMLYFILFLFELILLFFLSKRLINSLSRLIYRFTGSHKIVVHTLAIIFLPGTIFHELAHLLFAGIMFVPVGEMNVIPEIEEKGVRLGNVQIGKTDPIRRAIVGVAPIIFGMVLILSALYFIQSQNQHIWWQIILVLYLVFEIGNTMFSSRKDLEGVIVFGAMFLTASIILFIALHFLSPTVLQSIWNYINSLNLEFMVNFLKLANLYLIAPIALDLLIIFLTATCAPGRNRTRTAGSEDQYSIR